MTHTLITTHIHQNTTFDTRWYWEPARTRTITVVDANGAISFVRSDWPGIVIAVTERVQDDEPVMVNAWPAKKPITCTDDMILWVPSGGWQCLGHEAALGVQMRELGPREAFWNTAFRRAPNFHSPGEDMTVASILDMWERGECSHILTG